MSLATTPSRVLTPVVALAIATTAAAAWWWSPRLVAGTPLADLGFVVNLAGVLAILFLADWLTERIPHRD